MSDARENQEAVKFGEQLMPYGVRLDLRNDPEFVKKFGKKVKAAGGSYSECRGHQSTRFVTLPCEQEALINEIWAAFGGWERTNKKSGEKMGTMVVTLPGGYSSLPAWVTVHDVAMTDPDPAYALRCKLALALMHARERGLCTENQPFTVAEKAAHDAVLAEKKAVVEQARREEAQSAVNALWALCQTEELRAKLVEAVLNQTLGGALTRLAKTVATEAL